MKLSALSVLLFSAVMAGGTRAKPPPHQRHHRNVVALGNRQVKLGAAGPSASGASGGPTSSTPSPSSSAGNSSSGSRSAASTSVTGTATATGSLKTSIPTPVVPVPSGGQNGVPPLSLISSGMSTGTPSPVASSYAPGATPPIPGVPVLPTAFVFHPADWPTQDQVPDTSSPEVQKWMHELDGFDIPAWSPTADGTCAGDPAAMAQASLRGWWTCGGTTRDTDITACPKQYDWGVSFDDGPSKWSECPQKLLNYLGKQNILATFFVVGSRVIERPAVLIEEYMTGHEISVHTWSHRPLTSLTTPQIVAELGWTRKAIQTVLGITPTTMRPPYGDIDDRVRAISLAMGMVPIIWTSAPASGPFDTNDWKVAGGIVDATTSFNTFEGILGNASTIPSGFIVLQHDLYEVTVDLAVGYTLDAALAHKPPLSLKPIGSCLNIPATNLYSESNKNTSFPYTNHTVITSSNTDLDPTAVQKKSNSVMNARVSVPLLVAVLITAGQSLFY
ncbi:hypothetical protein BJV78DRAFT_1208840 [Lactifluus subvellereus]|nr:hypothetical protein BJV78DRAFT_1208840 [Lactifluus subvellereus]